VRLICALVATSLLAGTASAKAQSLMVHASAGPTLIDDGYSLAAGVGFFPLSRVGVVVDVERTHLSSELTTDGRGGVTGFRGGTLTIAAAQLRVAPFGHEHIGPYGFAGFAAGVSRPNVNAMFPDAVTNSVRGVFFGGGISVPLGERLSLFGDARLMLGDEAGELLAVAPLRAGLAWRF
jgi:hypothetical protein